MCAIFSKSDIEPIAMSSFATAVGNIQQRTHGMRAQQIAVHRTCLYGGRVFFFQLALVCSTELARKLRLV